MYSVNELLNNNVNEIMTGVNFNFYTFDIIIFHLN